MDALVRELLGPKVSDKEIQFCATSIISQCINPLVRREGSKGKRGEHHRVHRIDDIDAYADHVIQFSLAGIRAIRDEAEKKRGGKDTLKQD
jgi:hypothetical protein